jgi:hypothetical protein
VLISSLQHVAKVFKLWVVIQFILKW